MVNILALKRQFVLGSHCARMDYFDSATTVAVAVGVEDKEFLQKKNKNKIRNEQTLQTVERLIISGMFGFKISKLLRDIREN